MLRGLALALPPLLVFGALFVAADAVFEDLVSDVFDFDLARVFGHLFLFGLVAWICAGLLGLAVLGGELSAPPERPAFLRLGIVEVGIVLALLDALFLVFVIVQVRYLFGGMDQVFGPNNLTYAEYARRGFFELVTVTALALPILLLAHWLLRPTKPWHTRLFRALSGLLVGLLFVVMASALNRMRLYTAEFGLTELRLYTTAFMLWMGVVVIWFLLTVLRDHRDRFAFGVLLSGFLAVTALNALNPDALVVETNIARHASGESLDAYYLTFLSADAVPPLLSSLDSMKKADADLVRDELQARWSEPKDDWRTFNMSRYNAQNLVKEAE